MKRQLFVIIALAAMLAVPAISAEAGGFGGRGHGRGVSHGHGFGHGFGRGLGIGAGIGFVDDGFDLAELYRELLNNVPYYALHPPVYYSYPVPRTYGYSPFAYPPSVMTPDIVFESQPVTIINPHVESNKMTPAKPQSDRSAATSAPIEPLVILNPYVNQDMVATAD
jgi:hypothetical protein